ncbi:tripartite motif-containing protein 3-like [Branchiostoma lanceolatum]|uniref:tripartite motif-containing protein 3-like n=1 Tax=Branchiostoma lanceolatum TaxID=7740 RepID=UPI00345252F3
MASAAEKILEEGLCCGICHDTYQHPKMLPCHHTFCKECLTEVAKLGDLCCPTCRHMVSLPTDGVAGLPNNFDLAGMSEKFAGLPADQERDVAQHCEHHPSHELRLYCKSSKCGVPIYIQCLEDSHLDRRRKHDIVTVKEEVENRMTGVNRSLEEKKKQIEKQSEYLKEIQDFEKKIKKEQRESEKSIQDSYAERVKLLTEDKDRLLNDIQQSYQDIKKDVAARKDAVLQQLNALADVVEEVEQAKEKHAIKILRHELEPKELRDKLEQTQVDPHLPPLEAAVSRFRPHKIKKEQLVNGKLVTKDFTSRRQTVVTRLSDMRDIARARFRRITERHSGRAPPVPASRSRSAPNLNRWSTDC